MILPAGFRKNGGVGPRVSAHFGRIPGQREQRFFRPGLRQSRKNSKVGADQGEHFLLSPLTGSLENAAASVCASPLILRDDQPRGIVIFPLFRKLRTLKKFQVPAGASGRIFLPLHATGFPESTVGRRARDRTRTVKQYRRWISIRQLLDWRTALRSSLLQCGKDIDVLTLQRR